MKYTKGLFVTASATAFLFACAVDVGPFFTPQESPENQANFNGGQIGLLTPALTKENELIAFRLLSGLKMAPQAGARKAGSPVDAADSKPTGENIWEEKRKAIKDPAAPMFINVYRSSGTGDQYVYYENCLADAFETAARTLDDRRASYGSAPAFRAWVAAQDQVFENCGGEKPAYPDSLPRTASALQRADRDYQIAAAHFYAQDFPEAEHRFRTIADDAATPWRHVASYLVGRTLLREATLQNNPAALPQAREQLMKVSSESPGGSLQESARKMIEHLDAVEHPQATMESLSGRLLEADASPASVDDALHQSAFVLRATSFQKALTQSGTPEAFDWVQTLEKGDKQHAVERWRSGKSIPWLTLGLMYASGPDSAVPELLVQADGLPENSPAFGTARYNAIRLRIERGDINQARAELDQVVAKRKDEPDSLVNGWRAERMRVATSFDDFLRWAPRRPITPEVYFTAKANVGSEILANDSTYVLNNLTPLAKLNAAAHSNLLPAWSAADIALAGWTRAFMLEDFETARALAPIVAEAHPDWQATLNPGSGAATDQWKFQAALLIALHHQFQPSARVDYRTELNSSGSWWCPVEAQTSNPAQGNADETNFVSWQLPAAFMPSKDVLSQQDLDIASREMRQLHEKGSTEMFLAPIIFSWAKSHPDDPLVPQALHRLVMVTRYGCRNGDPVIGQISKTAYDLLHKLYPTSPWTKQTPYWFK